MGEDRALIAIVKEKKRSLVVERVLTGERSHGALIRLLGLETIDSIILEFLTEVSYDAFQFRQLCNASRFVRKFAGRWFGKRIYIAGDFCIYRDSETCIDAYDFLTNNNYYDLIIVDITSAVLMAIRDLLLCHRAYMNARRSDEYDDYYDYLHVNPPREEVDNMLKRLERYIALSLDISMNANANSKIGLDTLCKLDEFYCDDVLKFYIFVRKYYNASEWYDLSITNPDLIKYI